MLELLNSKLLLLHLKAKSLTSKALSNNSPIKLTYFKVRLLI